MTAAEASGRVWRVGFRPELWAWSGWEWATDGRFPGRWDDLHGNFRTIYAGSSLLSADGPFKGCKPVAGGHAANKLKALPLDPPPKDSFEEPPVFKGLKDSDCLGA